MDSNFWKGVIYGIGGMVVFLVFMNLWGWVPWLLLAAGGAYGYYRITNKKPPSLSDPANKARQLAEEVDKRIEELTRKR